MPHDTNGPPCQCGCGENLPEGSPRRFKRGHAKAHNRKVAQQILKEERAKENQDSPPAPPPTADAFADLGNSWEGIQDPFANLGAELPDDPEPDAQQREAASGDRIIQPDGTILVTKQVARDIQGKLAFLMSMPASMLMPLDPICMRVVLDQTPEISARLTPIICQSQDMVQFFTRSSGFIMWISLGSAVWPVIQVVIAHHLTKSIGHDKEGNKIEKDYSGYKVG